MVARSSSEYCRVGSEPATNSSVRASKSAKVKCSPMNEQGIMFRPSASRRISAVFVCAALLFFAGGGTLFHHHTQGPDNACQVCQALHMPVLASGGPELVHSLQVVTWFSPFSEQLAPSDSFSLHRASRAPPLA